MAGFDLVDEWDGIVNKALGIYGSVQAAKAEAEGLKYQYKHAALTNQLEATHSEGEMSDDTPVIVQQPSASGGVSLNKNTMLMIAAVGLLVLVAVK